MKLWELFEHVDLEPLKPGEKRIHAKLAMKNLQAIETKINQLRNSLLNSAVLKDKFTQDTSLQAALDKLIARVRLNLSYLEKMKSRPAAGPTKMVDILNNECSEFLAIVKRNDRFLYRGLRDTASVFEARSWQNRQPKDSSNDISLRFDQALNNAGFQALRSNSIFTTTDYHFANSYGSQVYMIFPKNGFNFLTTNTRDLLLNHWEKLADERVIYEFADKLNTWGLANVETWTYTQLAKRIKYHSELINLLADHFGYMGNPYNIPQEFNKTMEDFVTDDSIMQQLEPTQTSIDESMREGREILIHGEYWALKRDDWENFLSKRLWN